MVYAIVRSGGQQHLVEPDQVVDVDRLHAEVGSTVELNDVLLVSDEGDTVIGQPSVAGASVVAEVVEHGRDAKLLVFKYKSKTRYRRKMGHRQSYTRLAVKQILTGGEPRKKTRRSQKGAAGSGTRRRRTAKPTKQEDVGASVENVAAGEVQTDTAVQPAVGTEVVAGSKKSSKKGTSKSSEGGRKVTARRTVRKRGSKEEGVADGP